MKVFRTIALLAMLAIAARSAPAQNPIVIGVRGSANGQPALVVLAGRGLDSVRRIVERDLMNSDRFSITPLSDSAATLQGPFDPGALKNLGLVWAVELEPAVNGVEIKLYDIATGTIRQQGARPLDPSGVGDTRLTIHRLSDEIVKWTTGGIGMAASRVAFKWKNGSEDAIWRIDSDGANLVRVTRAGIFGTPAWSPDGSTIAYSEVRDFRWTLYLQKFSSGTRTAVTTFEPGDNFGGNFSPDGRYMVYSHNLSDGGTAIGAVDVKQNCCARALTTDRRHALNVSPSYSPDGRHIAYISNRTGSAQVWVMDDDGSSPEQLVATEISSAGKALDSNSPAWSPDGTRIAFSRETEHGGRQIYSSSVSGGQVVGRTAVGSINDDPSWAPDSRHIVFKSNRSGREQLWIVDIESANLRQLTTVPGGTQFPAWSHPLGNNP